MKKIEAIIRPAKVSDVCSALERVGHPGLMVSEIEGYGKQRGIEQRFRGKIYKIELLPKARVEIIVKDSEVDTIINAIREAAFTGKVGDGKIFVYPIANAVRIRTKEQGEVAL